MPSPKPPSLRDILNKSTAYLGQRKIDSPRLSVELLVAHALGMQRLGLYLDLDRPLSEEDLSAIRPLLARRGAGEPVAYILGHKEFYGLNFTITRDVLAPRPETELGVDLALGLCSPEAPLLFADVGTGSGILAVSLLVHLPKSRCLASDISRPALKVARANAKRHGVEQRLLLAQADLLEHLAGGCLDLIVANLPYLGEAELGDVSREVSEFEPRGALVAGPRGDELFIPLLVHAMRSLKPGGHVLLETGFSQADDLAGEFGRLDPRWSDIKVVRDHAGLERYVQACWWAVGKKQQDGAEDTGEKPKK